MGKIGLGLLATAMLFGTVQFAIAGDDLGNGGKNPGNTVNHPCQLKCDKMNANGAMSTPSSSMKKTTALKPNDPHSISPKPDEPRTNGAMNH